MSDLAIAFGSSLIGILMTYILMNKKLRSFRTGLMNENTALQMAMLDGNRQKLSEISLKESVKNDLSFILFDLFHKEEHYPGLASNEFSLLCAEARWLYDPKKSPKNFDPEIGIKTINNLEPFVKKAYGETTVESSILGTLFRKYSTN